MPDEIIIDGLEEHAFRRSIESMLRHGRAEEAADRLINLLPDLSRASGLLPERLLYLTADDIILAGLEELAAKLDDYGRPESPITAIGIGVCDPVDLGLYPDDAGRLRPPVETTYYSDATYPFSQTDRQDLLEGYSSFGCEWQGDHDRADHALSIEGINDVYGAIVTLENKVADSENPSAQDIRAGAVGACYLNVLIFQAVRNAVIRQGLPRPLAILLVNSDAYPFFDAPVLTCGEYLGDGSVPAIERAQITLDDALPDIPASMNAEEPEEIGSLIGIGGSGARAGVRKQMALALEGEEAANPLGMADELVAQAAFDPDSLDISSFMPQVPASRTFADIGHAEPGDDSDDPPPARKIDFPVDAILPQWREPAPRDESAPPEEPRREWSPRPPDPAFSEPEAAEHAASPCDGDESTVIGNSNGPWYEDPANSSLHEEPAPAQPAGHALRSRIRIAPPVEEEPSALAKLGATLTGILKRVQDLLLRR